MILLALLLAVPADLRLSLRAGEHRIERIAPADRVETEGPLRAELAISPWGVKLEGARDPAEKRRALRAVWPAILGPLRLDD